MFREIEKCKFLFSFSFAIKKQYIDVSTILDNQDIHDVLKVNGEFYN